MYGESGDVDEATIQAAVPSLQTFVKDFEARNAWNAEVFGLFCKLATTRNAATHRLSGKKKKQKAASLFLLLQGWTV